jgi:hypothetical protein
MKHVYLGQVTHFFNKICVAVLSLSDTITVGDKILISGRTTDLEQTVRSMQIDHRPVEKAGPKDDVALEVLKKVRRRDKVYKIVEEE